MGLGSRQTHTATLPPGQFHCLLDELPLHLVPQRQLQSQYWWLNLPAQQLFANPQCAVLPPRAGAGRTGTASLFAKEFQLAGNCGLGA